MNRQITEGFAIRFANVIATFVFLLAPTSVIGQEKNKDDALRQYLNLMFENIDKKNVPTGYLRDYAVEDEDLDLFNGNTPLQEENNVTIVRYADLLSTISSASLLTDTQSEIDKCFDKYTKPKDKGMLELSMMLYQYARIKENALCDSLIEYKDGKVYNTHADESPYQLDYVFAACCLTSTLEKKQVTVVIPKGLQFSNCSIETIEIDCGAGYQEITSDFPLQITLKEGYNDIKVKVLSAERKEFVSHSKVFVIPDKYNSLSRTRNGNDLVTPDEVFTVYGQDYRGIQTSAEVSIKYACGRHSLQKPLIIVEGFDPRVLVDKPKGGWSFESVTASENIKSLINKEFYDLVYVDWVEAEEYIQANSYTLIEIIKRINALKRSNGSVERNVIIGHSMGGLITRYALKVMENNEEEHQVSTYVSYDAPHLGAHIPLGVLYGFHGILDFIESRGLMKKILQKTAGEYLELGKSLAYSTSAQQMLVYYVDPAGHFNNQEHIRWQRELNSLGFPKGDKGTSIQLLAVSNSNYNTPNVPDYFVSSDFSTGSDALSTVFPMLSAIGVGIGLNDIVSGLLTVLPGHTSIRGHYNLSPAKKMGDCITDISLKYKKKFLWICSISKKVFSYTRYFPSTYLFDVFPGSTYGVDRDSQGNVIIRGKDGIPLLYDYEYDVKVAPEIQFIPTSSALAYGDGLNSNSSLFMHAPESMSSPFEKNYYTHINAMSHKHFTPEGLEWITQHLDKCIVGPKVGYDKAQYVLSSASGEVIWSSSNPSIATINPSGILSVNGKGEVLLTARCDGNRFSQLIVVGMPRYTLKYSHEPGGYKVHAECIDSEYADAIVRLNELFKFKWGIKYQGKDIRWVETDKPDITFQLKGEDEDVNIFLEVADNMGNKSSLQHIVVNGKNVYIPNLQNFFVDAQGSIYKDNGTPYSYKYARLYVSYISSISNVYKERKWMPMTADVQSPSGENYEISLRNKVILIKDILPSSEIEWIKANADEGQTFVYLLALNNTNDLLIQFLPVYFTYKTKV